VKKSKVPFEYLGVDDALAIAEGTFMSASAFGQNRSVALMLNARFQMLKARSPKPPQVTDEWSIPHRWVRTEQPKVRSVLPEPR
jgi:hypothetical protein